MLKKLIILFSIVIPSCHQVEQESSTILQEETSTEVPLVEQSSLRETTLNRFFEAFHSCVNGKHYVWGGRSCSNGSDCSGAIAATWKRIGFPAVTNPSYLERDPQFISCNGGPYKAGDHILLGKSCSSPDHWVTLYEVNDHNHANSVNNKILDQSTDCAPYCGLNRINMRGNLARRKVCQCARHKSLINP